MRPLLDRLQGLLAALPGLLRLPAAALLPALRAALVSLGVDGQPALKLLQEKAVRLLVAAFHGYPAQVGAAAWQRCGVVTAWLFEGFAAVRGCTGWVLRSPGLLHHPSCPALAPTLPSGAPLIALPWQCSTVLDDLLARH